MPKKTEKFSLFEVKDLKMDYKAGLTKQDVIDAAKIKTKLKTGHEIVLTMISDVPQSPGIYEISFVNDFGDSASFTLELTEKKK